MKANFRMERPHHLLPTCNTSVQIVCIDRGESTERSITTNARNLRTWEELAGGPGVQGHLTLSQKRTKQREKVHNT